MNIKQIKLPVILQKEITCLFQYSLPLCAALAYPHMHNWYLENYMDIVGKHCSNDTIWFWIYDAIDYIEENSINEIFNFQYYDLKYCTSNFNLPNFISSELRQCNYLIIFCDEFYISASAYHNTIHFVHEYLVYGYDNLSSVLNCIGFNSKGIYDTLEINISEFEKAFLSATSQYSQSNPLIISKAIISFKIPEKSFTNCDFSIKEKIKKYFSSSIDENEIQASPIYNIPLKTEEQLAYGIKTYDLFEYSISALRKSNSDIDIRLLLFLTEIKKSILHRLTHLQKATPKLKHLIAVYDKEVIQKLELFKLHFIKISQKTNDNRFIITSDSINSETVIDFVKRIKKIRIKETQILDQIITNMDLRYNNNP